MFGWEAWFTLGVVVLVFGMLLRRAGPTDAVLWGGAVLLAVAGVVSPRFPTPDELLSGLSEPALVTVAALFIISAAMRETGALDLIGKGIFGKAKTERSVLARMAPQVVGLSAFLNNTAVVAMLMPAVSDWCRRVRVAPSRLMIPLSYLSILGGLCTLIGTSTNLVVVALMTEHARQTDDEAARSALSHVAMFDFAYVGVPMAVAGIAYLAFVGRRLLPNREDLLEQLGDATRDYLANMRIESTSPLAGRTVEEAGLRRLPGLFLIEITREDRIIAPVEPDEVLLAGDRLSFAGVVATIVELERIPGLVPAEEETPTAAERRHRRYCEAVISSSSPLAGRSIRDANFRALHNAAVIAVRRGGQRLAGRIGDITLQAGDTLLLQSGPHFAAANRNNADFFLVSAVEEARPVRHERTWIAIGLLALLILLLSFGPGWGIGTALGALLVAGLAVMTRCISAGDARRSVRWDVLLTIAAAFVIGHALQKTGAARGIAELLISFTGAWGPIAALAVVYCVTTLFTEMITNNAAAVLVFPIAMSIADELGVNPRPFAFAVAYAASCSFATPIGYQTNLMVAGPGGYGMMDFVRVGLPLNLLMAVIAILVIPLVWPLTAS